MDGHQISSSGSLLVLFSSHGGCSGAPFQLGQTKDGKPWGTTLDTTMVHPKANDPS